MRPLKSALVLPVLLGLCASQSQAAQPNHLVITPTYDSTITSDPNAMAIEAGIQAAINVYETKFSNNNTVSILFQEGGGLGESSTYIGTIPYSNYVTALRSNEAGQSFLTYVPNSNPLNNGGVQTTLADLRTLGFSAGNLSNYGLSYDSTITLNASIMNLSRTGTQNPNYYDLQAVASHEIDEVLGLGSALNGLSNGAAAPTDHIGPLDLFRYSGNSVRSFNTAANTAAYLSSDGGVTKIVYFNQTAGGDFHDWYSDGSNPNAVLGAPQVQDAFGSPGSHPNLGNSEITALQMVGYNLSAPEPSQFAALGLGAVGLVGMVLKARRRRVVSA